MHKWKRIDVFLTAKGTIEAALSEHTMKNGENIHAIIDLIKI